MSLPDGQSSLGSRVRDAAATGLVDTTTEHSGSLFLRSLPAPDLRRMEPHLKLRTFAREEIVQNGGEMIENLVFPHDITLSLVCVMGDGTIGETATVGSEGYLGVESMLGSAVAICSAVAQHGRATVVPLDRLLILGDQIPSLKAAMLAYARNYLAMVSRLAVCNAVHSLKQRACRRLLLTLDQTEQQSVVMTQEELARALGVGRTSVNQACKELREDNIIDYSRGHIRIRDAARMATSACDCYSTLKGALGL
jgi:CRP-like cAMP-binding protein